MNYRLVQWSILCEDDKKGLNKLQAGTITIDLTLKNCPKFKLQTVTITIDLTLKNCPKFKLQTVTIIIDCSYQTVTIVVDCYYQLLLSNYYYYNL